tara:strand:+ start:14044 stop:14286 length:243 start_codon:yes stop_codon:yes gene_type:complete
MSILEQHRSQQQLIESSSIEFPNPSKKIAILVQALRLVAKDEFIKSQELYIPDDCEKYGFAEGRHNLGTMVQFFADMLEE